MFEVFRGRLKVPIRKSREAIQGRVQARVHPRDTDLPSYSPMAGNAFRLSRGPWREPRVRSVGREGLALAGPGGQAAFAGASRAGHAAVFLRGDYDPGFTNVLGAGSTSRNPFGVTATTARPRSAVPSGRNRKMPSTPAKPFGSVSAARVKRL